MVIDVLDLLINGYDVIDLSIDSDDDDDDDIVMNTNRWYIIKLSQVMIISHLINH